MTLSKTTGSASTPNHHAADRRSPSEELLVRLITTTGEVIPPGMFLPVAERFGLIADVDRWVLRKAIERAATNRRVEVNVSAWTIAHDDLIPFIERLLLETGADPAMVIEITETALMQDLDAGANLRSASRRSAVDSRSMTSAPGMPASPT